MNSLFSNKKKKIVLSPHFDDFAISLGGLAFKWSANECDVEDVVVFSNSEFAPGYNIASEKRKKIISKLRFQEEMNATKKIGNIKIRLCNQDDAPIRRHHELYGSYNITRRKDREAINNIYELINTLLFSSDIQLFVPLAVKEHVDHLIVRNVVINSILKNKNKMKAQVFFYEDLPYAASANKDEQKKIGRFIKDNQLVPITYPIDLGSKLKLLDNYKSQPIQGYYDAINRRAEQIQEQSSKKTPSEKVFMFSPQNAVFKHNRLYPLETSFLLNKSCSAKSNVQQFIDKKIGETGIFLKNISPELYYALKRVIK